ncbi:hypothetical protein LSS_21145 [Leptospira santarosai serovar Shermani str. LT 821]|uniref:Uncharacterized protein n=1 Tax=Leptospira santarosai serovar Shermani str. LT 821 TaxID=758847 RepID=A0A097ESC7_9LEPT|nr:hypothetical protein LSS_21145 [Leptospira santarosai serovar Shermani str. LT 821]
MERLEKARRVFVGAPTSYGKTQKAIFRRNMWELPRIVINLTTDSSRVLRRAFRIISFFGV